VRDWRLLLEKGRVTELTSPDCIFDGLVQMRRHLMTMKLGYMHAWAGYGVG
jgi:hypothetical protein